MPTSTPAPTANRQPRRQPRPCPQCQYGYLQPRTSTYQTTLHGQLFTAFHLPAWHCDLCGLHEFDPAALAQIALLTHELSSPPTEPEPEPGRPAKLPTETEAERPPRSPARKFKR